MRVEVGQDTIEVLLSRWQKVLGLMGDIRVPLRDISDVEVIEEPVREAMATGLKAGLRLPWLYYVARTIRLDEAFLVRRGVPGLSFTVNNHEPLRRVLVSTPQAQDLARRIGSPAPAAPPAS
ncbi:MAG: hypothetical protein ACLQBB_13360 [Solirubrobacteraceae bacterium]